MEFLDDLRRFDALDTVSVPASVSVSVSVSVCIVFLAMEFLMVPGNTILICGVAALFSQPTYLLTYLPTYLPPVYIHTYLPTGISALTRSEPVSRSDARARRSTPYTNHRTG